MNLNDTPSLGPLTAADFDAPEPASTVQLLHRQSAPMDYRPARYEAAQAMWHGTGVAMCSGPCRQGRDACPTPDACRISAERGDRHRSPSPVFVGLLSWPCLLSAALVFGIAAWAVFF